jgi:hypothetical protein
MKIRPYRCDADAVVLEPAQDSYVCLSRPAMFLG